VPALEGQSKKGRYLNFTFRHHFLWLTLVYQADFLCKGTRIELFCICRSWNVRVEVKEKK